MASNKVGLTGISILFLLATLAGCSGGGGDGGGSGTTGTPPSGTGTPPSGTGTPPSSTPTTPPGTVELFATFPNLGSLRTNPDSVEGMSNDGMWWVEQKAPGRAVVVS